MDETSARLALPLLEAGQAQKEMTVNEALALLDLAVQARVVAAGIDDPPAAPAIGECWIVGEAPTGDWADQAGALAGWTGGGWRFVAAAEGMTAWVSDRGLPARRVDGAWEIGETRCARLVIDGIPVVGAQAAAIADPAGGTVVDAEVRASVGQILAALRQHGLIAS